VPFVASEQQAVFTARVDPRTSARPGDFVRLAVDPSRFHFFEPGSGRALTGGSAQLAGASA
jgi:multiple sugar transport system ATP-binding protein